MHIYSFNTSNLNECGLPRGNGVLKRLKHVFGDVTLLLEGGVDVYNDRSKENCVLSARHGNSEIDTTTSDPYAIQSLTCILAP